MDKVKYAGMWIKTETGDYVTPRSFFYHKQSEEIVYYLDHVRMKESLIDANIEKGIWEAFTAEQLRGG